MTKIADQRWSAPGRRPPRLSAVDGSPDSGHRITLGGWLLVITIAYVLTALGSSDLTWLGWSGVAASTWIYMVSGGVRLDAVSVWALAGLLFVGIAAVLLPPERLGSPGIGALAVYLALVSIIVTTAIAWWPQRRQPSRGSSELQVSAGMLLLLSVIGFLIGLAMRGNELLASLSQGFVSVGVLLAVLGAASVRGSPLALLVPGLLFLLFLATWPGSGRLAVLSLLVASLMAYQYRKPPRTVLVKALALPLLVPALFVAALIEFNRTLPTPSLLTIPYAFDPSRSLYSVWSPLWVFISLLGSEAEGLLERHGLHTFLAAATSLVPRSLWSNKPDGWGRELAYIFNPVAAQNSNHSEAGLLPAEFLWGFGIAGVVAGILLAGLLLRFINRGLTNCCGLNDSPGFGRPALLSRIVIATSLFSLFWTGSFTFLTRAAVQLIALVVLMWIGRALGAGSSRRSPRWMVGRENEPSGPTYNQPQSGALPDPVRSGVGRPVGTDRLANHELP